MSAADVVVLVAAVVGCIGAVVALVVAGTLGAQVRRLERAIDALREDAVPLVHEARLAADHALSELSRVDAVLADTESVTATVDGAVRLAQRAFANPVVKFLAWRAGAVGGFRRLRGGPGRPAPAPQPALERRQRPVPARPGHRRRLRPLRGDDGRDPEVSARAVSGGRAR